MDETKKYIIEFSEDPYTIRLLKLKNGDKFPVTEFKAVTPYTEPDLDAIRNEAYEKGVQDTKQHWVDAPRSCAYKLGYENGLNDNDGWEAARKIYLPEDHGGLGYDMLMKIFNTDNKGWIFKNLSAPEAIERIRQYEQEKEEQIRVGDEVTTDSGKAVVTGVGPVHFEYIFADGSHGYDEVKNVKKTGRRFPEIAEVLAKMKESDNG